MTWTAAKYCACNVTRAGTVAAYKISVSWIMVESLGYVDNNLIGCDRNSIIYNSISLYSDSLLHRIM